MSQSGLHNFSLSKEELIVARGLTKKFGTSYFWATLLFPKSIRHATYVLYAFFRIPDEYVDSATSVEDAALELQTWRDAWRSGQTQELPIEEQLILSAAARVFEGASMPAEYAESFLRAMEQDLTVAKYQTYHDLEAYMYGSAAVVGLMMTEVIGYSDMSALAYAQKLGEAMQLTNFLRDIGEDWDDRKRIYIPQEDLDRFGVSKDMIANKQVTTEFINLMKFEIQRARDLYTEAEQGIALLLASGRKPVYAALVLYRAILSEIESNGYDTLAKRARTSSWTKVRLLVLVFAKHWN